MDAVPLAGRNATRSAPRSTTLVPTLRPPFQGSVPVLAPSELLGLPLTPSVLERVDQYLFSGESGGHFDFAYPSARTVHPHVGPRYVWMGWQNPLVGFKNTNPPPSFDSTAPLRSRCT